MCLTSFQMQLNSQTKTAEFIVKTENIKQSDIDKTKLIGVENPVFYDEYIKVSVSDSGIGIAPEDLKKVFDQFQQIENSLNRKNGGTGLGLPDWQNSLLRLTKALSG